MTAEENGVIRLYDMRSNGVVFSMQADAACVVDVRTLRAEAEGGGEQ